jgi:hypothetical protein
MKIIINLYGKTADIAAPRHHLRLGCVAPHWKLNEWLRRRRIPNRAGQHQIRLHPPAAGLPSSQ